MGSSLLSYEDALAAVLAVCVPVGIERVPLEAARGRVVAQVPDVTTPLPPFANSAMDGFAVRAADLGKDGATLPLDPAVPAGTAPGPLTAGHAAPIATGGPIPTGADAIVPIEQATRRDGRVELPGRVEVGAFVRTAGSDLPVGPAPLSVGVPLDAAAGAVLASVGATEVAVFRRPRVTVLTTGSELVPPDRTPGPAQIRDSNSTALAWTHAQAGADVRMVGIAIDEEDALRALLVDALDADLVITCAGASVGERDLVRSVLAELDVAPVFWGVDLKPGKPVALGRRGDTPVISLPGNPASALVCSSLLAEPATRARGGWRHAEPVLEWAIAGHGWPPPEGRMHAVRCSLAPAGELGVVATPTGDQRSHRIGSMVGADALALVPAGSQMSPGERVRIIRT